MTAAHLVAEEITTRFAGLVANDCLSIEVRPGEVVGLIGPNGAGKTTFFNCITGFITPSDGRVILDGIDITDEAPADRARRGMARTFQQAKLFDHLSVRENLLLGRHITYGARAWHVALGLPRARQAEATATAHVNDLADELGLTTFLDARVADLPYGTRRMVEVSRALAGEPSLLLLDEPAAGMDSAESVHFGRLLRAVHGRRDLSVLLIEHDVAMVLAVCDRIYVVDFGRLIAEGDPDDIRSDPEVRAAYLGSEVTHG